MVQLGWPDDPPRVGWMISSRHRMGDFFGKTLGGAPLPHGSTTSDPATRKAEEFAATDLAWSHGSSLHCVKSGSSNLPKNLPNQCQKFILIFWGTRDSPHPGPHIGLQRPKLPEHLRGAVGELLGMEKIIVFFFLPPFFEALLLSPKCRLDGILLIWLQPYGSDVTGVWPAPAWGLSRRCQGQQSQQSDVPTNACLFLYGAIC